MKFNNVIIMESCKERSSISYSADGKQISIVVQYNFI